MQAPEFWQDDGAPARLLAPLGWLHGALGQARRRLVRPRRAPAPVLCVGNLTVGGAGKTPTVLALVEHLRAQGATPHCLTRGYGGRARGPLRVEPGTHAVALVGDEALLLARAAPTWVARDRVAGAAAAVAAGADLLLLDDGFQNPHLHHDLALVVVDGGYGFGNGRPLPAGPLREPLRCGLGRASAVLIIGADRRGIGASLPPDRPRLAADLVPAADSRSLAGRRMLAFAGIGRPAKFFETLHDLGAVLAGTQAFPDHHPYRRAELEELLRRAAALGAVAITTEKDRVRMPPDLAEQVAVLPVRLAWREPAALTHLVAPLLAARQQISNI
jgi:tetraacyldisaccharide 4'-kinase